MLDLSAQGGTYFTIKAGPSIGVQRWEGFQQGPLFAYHASVSAETADIAAFSVYGQLGYHLRGSA